MTVNLPHPLAHALPRTAQPPHVDDVLGTWTEHDASASTLRVLARHASLPLLLVCTALLYVWNLGASGWSNQFYAAAAQSGSLSWKPLLFGSLDPSNAITVDKPPASLWLMGISERIVGMNSWGLLLPEALCGVATVWLTFLAVRRVAGHGAGIAAGALLALTPVAALMFRFDNPDALLVLLLTGSAYALTRALERGAGKWLVLAGTLIGFAFLAKMLQAFLIVPGFALVYLYAAPVGLARRVWHVAMTSAVVAVAGGWWLALVAVWPAASRPYIGGSQHNSAWELALGYNGLQRISGGGASFSGAAGLGRLFNAQMGGEISWLLPAALVAFAGGMVLRHRLPRTDAVRAALLVWGTWLVGTALVFSFMTGVVHTYYTVALAPPLAALLAIGGRELWHARRFIEVRVLAAAGIAASAWWSWVLLGRAAGWHGELRWLLAVAAASAVALLLVTRNGAPQRWVAVPLSFALSVAVLAGPGAWTFATAATPHTGSTPTSGPAVASTGGMGGGPGGGMGRSGAPDSGTSSTALTTLLRADDGAHRWAAATQGSMSAGALQLASGQAVLAMGGFNGGDPYPSLEQFEALVLKGDIHYYVADGGMGGGGRGPGGGSANSAIASWVSAHYTAQTVDGSTVYDLTRPAATTSLAASSTTTTSTTAI